MHKIWTKFLCTSVGKVLYNQCINHPTYPQALGAVVSTCVEGLSTALLVQVNTTLRSTSKTITFPLLFNTYALCPQDLLPITTLKERYL